MKNNKWDGDKFIICKGEPQLNVTYEAGANAMRKVVVLLLTQHYFGSLPDGRDTFAFTREELLYWRDWRDGNAENITVD